MAFAVISSEKHTAEGYGMKYNAKHTRTTTYRHPKGLLFKHVHIDGKDYEDSYEYETVTIGETEIMYSSDRGNYFVREDVRIKRSGKQVSYAEKEEGAVDPRKTKTEHKEEGLSILKQLGAEFGLSQNEFVNQLSNACNIKLDVLKLFLT